MNKKVELLAPAGGEEQLIAAVENGADAIYVGGTLYNARMNAANLDDEAMQRCLDYAHKRGVKVFVTMNTLLWDDELQGAVDYARKLYAMGADALIIQDLGLGWMIRREMPDFPLHLSTQATTSDAWGVRAARALGYERVVLSRELSMEEIRSITRAQEQPETTASSPELPSDPVTNALEPQDGCAIEVFVHGALCICYSGQCQLSRYYGGRSGNRGECAQPCRLPYYIDGNTQNQSYFLSPRDICMIDHIGELIDAGVASFKIEGRMKSSEYVSVVTSIYRKYIDEYYAKGTYTVSDEDRVALEQIFNRGGFTDGYYNGDPGSDLMCAGIPKNQGVKIGKVVRAVKNSQLIDIELSDADKMGQQLSIGDGVEIRRRSPNGAADTIVESRIVTYLETASDKDRANKGNRALLGMERNNDQQDRYRIGDFKQQIRSGDKIYRTSSKLQLEAARSTFVKPQRKREIDMKLFIYEGVLKLTASTIADANAEDWPSLRKVTATAQAGPYDRPEIDGRATPRERYISSLSKTGSTPFAIRNLEVRGDLDVVVKASEINDLRRRCLEELENKLCFRRELPASTSPASPITNDGYALQQETEIGELVSLAELCLAAVPLEDSYKRSLTHSERIPFITAVPKGRESELIESRFDECVELCRSTGLLCGNLGWLKRFADAGVNVVADRGINITNAASVSAVKELGAVGYRSSNETCEDPEPLMVTEHYFDECSLESGRGHKLNILHYPFSDKTYILLK